MAKVKINISALQAALDQERSARGLSWRQLAGEIGVTPSLLSRLRNGFKPDADGFATLVTWLGIPAEKFLVEEGAEVPRGRPELMAEVTALLRARQDLDDIDAQYLEDIIQATLRHIELQRRDRE